MPTKTQIAKLTELIFDKLSTTEYHPIDWRTAIYAGLLERDNHKIIDYSHGNQNTWKLNHSWRSAMNKSTEMLNECCCKIDFNENLIFHCIYENQNAVLEEIKISLKVDDFKKALWSTIGVNNKKILNSKNERAFLFNSIVKVITQENNDNNVIINRNDFDEDYNENEIHPKIRAIFHLYSSIHNAYNNNNLTDEEQTFFQYALGASLFYLPHPEKCWNGRISMKAINHILEGGNKVKDHITPRKFAAKQLLEEQNPLTLKEVADRYWNDYSYFTYVTTNENYLLRNYYTDGSTYEEASELNGIKWICLNNQSELRKFMKYLIDKKLNNNLTYKKIDSYLTQFRNL
ncbi:hypothetical protein [Flavobacterium sp. W22_SRS_FP1]|uniref:hypothetical protein n=1 Tax=Flavobacterium sp. W22_SRS_FP1 TaxID=3240276 RepID=UPI003F930492